MDGTEVVQSTSTKSSSSPCNTTSPLSSPSCATNNNGTSLEDGEDDGDISVGCPSPAPSGPQQVDTSSSSSSSCFSSTHTTIAEQDTHSEETVHEDDYFKPLKKLKMMQINKVSVTLSTKHLPTNMTVASTPASRNINSNQGTGVKSFSILDILNHRPRSEAKERVVSESNSARIVRPWDLNTSNGVSSPPPLHHRPKSADLCYASETLSSTCSSGRSSTAGSIASDCCTSPDIINCTITNSATTSAAQVRHHAAVVAQHHRHFSAAHRAVASGKVSSASGSGKTPNTSPLDALFQMTSKTFEELNGEAVSGKSAWNFRFINKQNNMISHQSFGTSWLKCIKPYTGFSAQKCCSNWLFRIRVMRAKYKSVTIALEHVRMCVLFRYVVYKAVTFSYISIIIIIIIIIRHELDLNRPVSASSNSLQVVFVHLVFNSALPLASCYCSFFLHVVANLICVFLVSGQLVLLSSFPKFLHSFCGQKVCILQFF